MNTHAQGGDPANPGRQDPEQPDEKTFGLRQDAHTGKQKIYFRQDKLSKFGVRFDDLFKESNKLCLVRCDPEHEGDPCQYQREQDVIKCPGERCGGNHGNGDHEQDQRDQHIKDTFQDHRCEYIKRAAPDQPAHDDGTSDLSQPQRQQVQQIAFRDGEKAVQAGRFIVQYDPPCKSPEKKGDCLQQEQDQE